MSQELFGETSKRRNKKQEDKRKIEQENGRKLFDDKLYTINLFCYQMKTTLEMGLGDAPPPPLHFTLIENTPEICVFL